MMNSSERVVMALNHKEPDDEYNILWKKGAYDYSPVESSADCTLEDLDKATWPDPYDPE